MTNGRVPLFAQKEPGGIETVVRYDPTTGLYIFEKRIGQHLLETPITMTQKEYLAYRLKKMQGCYFLERNREAGDSIQIYTNPFTGTGLKRKTDPLTHLFGPGGIQLTTKGTVEIGAGIKKNITNNPILPQHARKRSMFNFDQQIQLNLNAKVGNKIDFNLNYDTEATFDFQSKEIKLAYRGNEDEIIRNIEAGNLSMTTDNPLIDGGAALFGIKADLQFGNLRVNTLFSRQNSEVKTVNSSGGKQVIPFSFSADEYDENRHFFLAHWFRDNYNHAMGSLPFVRSPISITRIEVWVTNRKGDYSQVRNVIALTDLGEQSHIENKTWQPIGTEPYPHNRSNTLYEELTNSLPGIRNIRQGEVPLPGNMANGIDYEKIENARLLTPSEYNFQPQLGYLSLAMPLLPDEMLAVAFEYSCEGEVYQVGEFSDDIGTNNGEDALFLKLLKPVSLSPVSPTWDLMMKNIYSLGYGVHNLEEEGFILEITRQNDTTGVYLNYLPGSGIDQEILLRVMQLDRLNKRGDPHPDGIFDYLDGYTVNSKNGTIIFPVTEPFGSHLGETIGDESIARMFLFQELYDSTRTVAQQLAEKNKFRISGEYRISSDAVISLNTMNVARGSVKVTAGGSTLTEGVDYSVDYLSGTVTILNQSILNAGTPVNVTLEEQTFSQMQRKTLMGVNMQYNLTKELSIGATMMHYTERPLIVKTAYGEEATKNILWGTNLNWNKESKAVTGLLNLLPFTHASAPSKITADLAFAQMIPGHYSNQYTGGHAYLDDFESAASLIDISSPYSWSLAATPIDHSASSLFPEGTLVNHIDNGKNRALLAWYYIDGIFTRKNSSLTPAHINNDPDQLSDHRVRAIHEQEVFPERELLYGQPTILPVLNLSYYPNERGPYNLDREVDSEGFLLHPADRWGGITRPLETRNFETANIEYIEFWLMDPFVYDSLGNSKGGDLYFHLGEISEDVLRDGKKFFENGIPANRDSSAVEQTVWGLTPKRQSTVYGFDNSGGPEVRYLQDVGLNGLSSEEEKVFPTYSRFLEELKPRLSAETLAKMKEDPHSPFNNPSGDLFRHYRGKEQDEKQLTILERYKYYNGTEGNSLKSQNSKQYLSASRNGPDGEDIDNDNTLNEQEAYYSYRVSLRKEDMQTGSNFIADKREASVTLHNGNNDKVTWYLFRIPIDKFQQRVGNIEGFHNIRFMRMLLTNFEEPLFLRFATLGLVRSDWRIYQNCLKTGGSETGSGRLTTAAVNIEENGNKTPVNYVMPPGITRIVDPSQPQLRQENEQAISMKVSQLESGEGRAIYKNSIHDLRRYKRIQMFVHAEQPNNTPEVLADGDLALFLRIGSDYRHNYYELEIPLVLTPEGRYSNRLATDRELVWPEANRIDFLLEHFTQLKLKRDARVRNKSAEDYFAPFVAANPEKPGSLISIIGNPTLGEIKVIMIGIRNKSESIRSGEIWINELRLSEYDEEGGWAVGGNLGLTLSDIGSLEFSAGKETAGFGALSEGLQQRRNNNYLWYNFSLNMDLGRFLPQKTKISAPLFYTVSNNQERPLYNPFSSDILLSKTMEQLQGPAERDSLQRVTMTQSLLKSMGLSNLKSNIRSASPMPYDPANFTFSYTRNQLQLRNPETEYTTESNRQLQALYTYTPSIKPWIPFGKSFEFRYLPNRISLSQRLQRNYRERQMRNLNALTDDHSVNQSTYLTFSHNFYWDRQLNLTWNITRRLSTAFQSGTVAEIEEPYLQVNKSINKNDYEIWRDSVMISLRNLGKPLTYSQITNINYIFPFESILLLNWIHSSIAYHAQYRWKRGAVIENEEFGNQLQNDLSFTLNSRLNLPVLYKKMNAADSPSLLAHTLMMVKHLNLNIGYKTRTDLPGYRPMSGDLFGQYKEGESLLPGLPFAFGLTGGKEFVEDALHNNWLVTHKEHILPAIYNRTKNVRVETGVEPIPGIRIDLHALHEESSRSEFHFMFEGMPEVKGGSFAMSTITLFSAFEKRNTNRQYYSAAFNRLLNNRSVVVSRIREQYRNTLYPKKGFLAESSLGGTPFSEKNGDVKSNSADVLIPAFLAAYSGKDANKITLSPFPSISSMLPNWNLSANLTTLLPSLRQHILDLMINHQYTSQYRIGSYNTHMSWIQADKEQGFISDAVYGIPLPSSPYNIQSVSIVEGFNPLIELRSALHNNINLSARINHTRSINLSIPSNQLIEMKDYDLTVSAGYKIVDFGRTLKINRLSSGRRSKLTGMQGAKKSRSDSSEPELKNDLTFRLDLSLKQTHALIRKLSDGTGHPTDGIQTGMIRFTADYAVSRNLTLRAFYDYMIQKPLVSSRSVATSNTNAGINLRIQFR